MLPTLRDVAEKAGVSAMTASRALRGLKSVRPATRDKVLACAAQLGYRQDPALSALASYRTNIRRHNEGNVIVFLKPQETAFMAKIEQGVRDEAARFGYQVITAQWMRTEAQQKTHARIYYHRGIRGILIGPDSDPVPIQRDYWDKFALLSLGVLHAHPAPHAVSLDYFDGLINAARQLEKAGYRRVGLLMDPSKDRRTGYRFSAAYHVLPHYLKNGLSTAPPLFLPLGESRGFASWVRKHKIDCCLTLDPAITGFKPTSHRIPEKFGIAFLNAFSCPEGAAHVSLDPTELGIEGTRQMHQLLQHQEYGYSSSSRRVALISHWMPGWTVRAAVS